MRNLSHTGCRKTQNAHFMPNNFFPKIVPFISVEIYDTSRQATDDNVTHAG